MQLADERLDLLIACVRGKVGSEERTQLRTLLLANSEALRGLLLAAERRLLLGAMIDGLEAKGILHPVWRPAGGPTSLRSELGRLRGEHETRRMIQSDALREIVLALNAQGIEPLVIKGAVSLLTGSPAWRFQRDLDFAIAASEADRTMSVLRDLGFSVLKPMSVRHHHLDCMWRGDLPVVVEPHIRINGPRAARLLDGIAMVSAANSWAMDGLKVRLLRPEHALIHGMVHHHFENRGGNFGVISLKGLMEFADQLDRLNEAAATSLVGQLSRRPRLKAAAELWVAASERWLDVVPPECLKPGKAAVDRIDRLTARLARPEPASLGVALREEIAGLIGASEASTVLKSPGELLWPLLDSLANRPWGGRPRALKAAGLLALC